MANSIAKRFDEGAAQFRCPQCGRYLSTDPGGYYDSDDKRDSGLGEVVYGYVAPFCNERCAGVFHGRAP